MNTRELQRSGPNPPLRGLTAARLADIGFREYLRDICREVVK